MNDWQQTSDRVSPNSFRHSPEELDRLAKVVKSAPFVSKVLDTMPELVAVMTPSRQIVAANQAMLVFLEMESGKLLPGDRPGELLGCVYHQVSPEGCGASEYCGQCGAFQTIISSIASGEKASGECRLTYEREGERQSLDLHLWCAPFQVAGEQFSILAGVDISDKKRREALEEIFFHDILNTFSVLVNGIELLDDGNEVNNKKLINILRGAADSLVGEVSSQRDLMHAEQGVLTVSPQRINTRVFLEDLVALFSNWRSRKRLLLIEEDSEDLEIEIDSTLLRRVITNMLKNALEASEIEYPVSLGCRSLGEQIEFWVHNRSAMPSEVQLQVFQRSFSTKGVGRGQGTYSMRLLSERYLAGTVDFISDSDQGTKFIARYPMYATIDGHQPLAS